MLLSLYSDMDGSDTTVKVSKGGPSPRRCKNINMHT